MDETKGHYTFNIQKKCFFFSKFKESYTNNDASSYDAATWLSS